MILRLETEKDCLETENLTREAFWNVYQPGCSEHLVLHNLRKKEAFIPKLSYLAVEKDTIVGHIAYSKTFYGEKKEISDTVIGFGPISVHPAYQKKGVGSQLIRYTIEKAKELGYKAIIITGDHKYYHTFGFSSATQYGIFLPGMSKDEEAEFFMAYEIEKGYLEKHKGMYDYDPCFAVGDEELKEFDKKFPPKTKREARESDMG